MNCQSHYSLSEISYRENTEPESQAGRWIRTLQSYDLEREHHLLEQISFLSLLMPRGAWKYPTTSNCNQMEKQSHSWWQLAPQSTSSIGPQRTDTRDWPPREGKGLPLPVDQSGKSECLLHWVWKCGVKLLLVPRTGTHMYSRWLMALFGSKDMKNTAPVFLQTTSGIQKPAVKEEFFYTRGKR